MTRETSNIISLSIEDEKKRLKLFTDKVKPISDYLGSSPQPAEKSAEKLASLLSSSVLAAQLFAKSPVDFLERKTLAELAHITSASLKTVESMLAARSGALVTVEHREDVTAVFVALGDRPFIVNTINECILSSRLGISVFLHPILLHENLRVSLSYLEVDHLSPEEGALLKARLERACADLILATDDYTAILVRTETLARLLDNPSHHSSVPENERREVAEFLRWLTDGSFVFLGHAEWRVDDGEISKAPAAVLGLFKSAQSYREPLLSECRNDAGTIMDRHDAMLVTRLNVESPVHRVVRMVHILVQENSTEGRTLAVHSIIGMLTSKAKAQESSSVPLIRRKLKQLIDIEEVVQNSHDYKYLVDIIDSMPKDEALRMDTESLREIVHTILGIQHKNETRVSLRFDSARRGASVLIVMPRERFNSQVRQRIQQYIESLFGAASGSSEYHLNYTSKPLVRFYFYVPVSQSDLPPLDLLRMQHEIADLSRTWRDNLRERLIERCGDDDGDTLFRKFADVFSPEYQALQSLDEAIEDIRTIDSLSPNEPVRVTMTPQRSGDPAACTVTAYSLGSELTLNRALPVLENSGLEVIHERSSVASLQPLPVHIHRFFVRSKSRAVVHPDRFAKLLGPGLAEILQERAENDVLNSLMLTAGLDIRSISLIRAYCSLLWQVNKFASRGVIFEALASVPTAASQLWNMFDIRFNHRLTASKESRAERFAASLNHYRDSLRDVTDITKDRILRAIAQLLENTVRTNFFLGMPSIALKISSRKVDIMPLPRPLFETYVRSPLVEAVHLRTAPVSRGGIRWSDRPEDFRSEVLGLVNTQTIKNVLIVPDGAKGGFIVRLMPKDPELVPDAVRAAYREFIRALLSLADNRAGAEVRHPENVIMWDDPDPYLVVAADKGTATFSDTANAIAVDEYKYWLGDAFASGGSNGYDHKKYAITARGAWESVKRHFTDLGVDYETVPFSVIGIGDMSGDVFGNGLLLSQQMRLVAAFDHRHIFVDPTPDLATSFQERKRLFEQPKSKWSDYRREIMSAGGGIFGRFEKEIAITVEMRGALGLADDFPAMASGEQLVNAILKAPCDLLWNGGIGTYVKSRSQSHADVNDGTNDRVRVEADELRVKIVAEGGNLGFTQLARVEFAERGGRINTDAIDNSGGVDLSDHEVNIKILLRAAVDSGRISLVERNKLLVDLAPQVTEAVLLDNRQHALVLTSAEQRSRRNIGYYHSFIGSMAKMNYLSRSMDCLPDDDEIAERAGKKQGMLRPELAICLAAAKRWASRVMLSSNLSRNTGLKSYLLDYFPDKLHRLYRDDIFNHPLGENIIATQVTNTLVNCVGVTFLHRMCMKHSASAETVLKCCLAAESVLRLGALRSTVWQFDTPLQRELFAQSWNDIARALRESTSWIISYHGTALSLEQIIELYQSRYKTLIQHAEEVFSADEAREYGARVTRYQELGLDEFGARSLAVFPEIIRVFEMLWTSRRCRKNVTVVATVFSQVLEELGVARLLRMESSIEAGTKWESELASHAYDDMRRSVSLITTKLLEKNIVYRDDISRAIRGGPNFEQLSATIAELRTGIPQVAAIAVLAKQLLHFELADIPSRVS